MKGGNGLTVTDCDDEKQEQEDDLISSLPDGWGDEIHDWEYTYSNNKFNFEVLFQSGWMFFLQKAVAIMINYIGWPYLHVHVCR